MKKLLLVVLLFSFFVGLLQAETKLKMELWNRWTYETYDGEVQQNEMALKRGYFRLEPQFSGNIKGRFNLDFFSDDGAADGVAIKLKYAYLDFANVVPIKDSKLTVGLMKTYFGTIYDWNYTTIEKDPSDKYKFVSSTDYGMGISGYYPKGLGTYAVAVYNGEGYKKSGDHLNKDLNFAINTRVTPMPGVTVGGSYMLKTKNDSEIDDGTGEMIDNPDRVEYNMIAGVGKFAFGPFSLLAQYLSKVTSKPNADGAEDVTTSVISFMPVFKMNDKFDLLARYDTHDPDTDADDDGEDILVLGANYNILRDAKNNPTLFLQANYEMITPENDDEESTNQIMLQMRWIFSETLNKK